MPQNLTSRLALIGMSGIGKSYWSKQLEQAGWVRFDCDDMIADRLGQLIALKPGEDAVIAVGRWMGMPWADGYAEREAQYLALERAVTGEALDAMDQLPEDQPAVLDTTGSVIYTGETLLTRLREQCMVVYLEAPASWRERMVKLYCEEPKPVLWQGAFHLQPGESHNEALPRCYRDLLESRAHAYEALQDVRLRADQLREGVSLEGFMGMVESA